MPLTGEAGIAILRCCTPLDLPKAPCKMDSERGGSYNKRANMTAKSVKNSVQSAAECVEIWEVMLDNATIKFNERLSIPIETLDKGTDEECLFAECPEFGISAVGVDFEELRSCLHSDIRMAWKRIFKRPDSELTPKDKGIKQRFLKLAEEISNGSGSEWT